MNENKSQLPATTNSSRGAVQLHESGSNSTSLINHALANLDKDQARNLMAKAGEKALELEVRKRTQDMDYVSGKREIDNHVQAFDILNKQSGRLTRQVVTSEVNTGAGKMKIESKSGATCFVATAAYGDANHPDVAYLRQFRDEVLSKTITGRTFIRAYWLTGPLMAYSIGWSKYLRSCAKWGIGRFVNTLRTR